MAKIEEKVEQLLAKHPSLTRPEATKIITAKNTRKRDKRSEKIIESMKKLSCMKAKRVETNHSKMRLLADITKMSNSALPLFCHACIRNDTVVGAC